MADKILKTRIAQKHDIETNWDKAVNFVPYEGEVIVYDADSTHTRPRIKVGDGNAVVSALPFVSEVLEVADVLEICGDTEIVAASEVKF